MGALTAIPVVTERPRGVQEPEKNYVAALRHVSAFRIPFSCPSIKRSRGAASSLCKALRRPGEAFRVEDASSEGGPRAMVMQ